MNKNNGNLEWWKIFVPTILVIISWFASDCLSSSRDVENNRREIILGYLIEAYRNIENGLGRDSSITPEQKINMEKALADIQLFGTLEEIKAAKKMAANMVNNSYDDPRYLLSLLRLNLRKELNLEKTSDDPLDIIHWRIK